MTKEQVIENLRVAIQDAEEHIGLVRTEFGQVITGVELIDDSVTLVEG